MKLKSISLCALLLTSMVFVALPEPATSHEEFPELPPRPFSDPPSLGSHGVSPDTGWNDTSFSFYMNASLDYFWNETIPQLEETVRVYVDSIPYDMFENDTKDTNWTDGKQFYWMNENRLWSKGLIPYFFYVEINESSNMSATNTFEIYNRAPYMLEPPLTKIYVGEGLEWEGRATDEDLDPLNWTIDSNITEGDVDEFEWETVNYSFKLKIKCNHTFVRWINLSVTDSYDNLAYWRWTLYCVENESGASPPGDYPKTKGVGDSQITADENLVLSPNADGHELDWTPKGGGSHYVEVDDDPASPDDDTTYISVTSGNQEDYWNLEDHTTETGTISNVRLSLRVKHSAGGEEFAFALSNGSSEYVGSDVADSTSWTTYYEDHAINPITSGDWYWGDIDYLQLGIKSRAIEGFAGTEYCTVGWIDITFSVIPTTGYYWCGSDCGGDGYKWDDEDNWRDVSDDSVNGYPRANDDTASFNETADDLYLVEGANSVVTIGALTTTTRFTGSITFSIDLILDDSGGKNGSLNHKAVATIDVNTSNEQINMDGNLYISSSATFTERSGTLIVQGAGTQEIRVQDSNKLYKFTVDTSSTVASLFDNLTLFQTTIGSGTTFRADANTRGYELWTNFSDIAGCGFVSTSAGTLNLIGTSTYGANITTTDASPPPTDYWGASITGALDVTLSHATLSYFNKFYMYVNTNVDVENTTFSYSGASSGSSVIIFTGVTINAFNNVTIDNTRALQCRPSHDAFYNVVMSSVTGGVDIDVFSSGKLEFRQSNFDITNVNLYTSGEIVSENHNDVSGDYKMALTSLSKSTITNKHDSGDAVDIISGKYILDESGAAKSIMAQDGTTLVLGKDVADASVTLTFDDTNWAGFANDVSNMGGIFAGKFYANGTATYPHTIRAANLPATTGWRGLDSYWPNPGYEHMVHNVTMYNSRAWHTGHEALAQYSNVTFDMKGVNPASGADFIIWEPTANSFFNDIYINGSIATSHTCLYIMPDASNVFIKNFVVTNFSGAGSYQVEVDEGQDGEVVHFRNSNFDETKFDYFGGDHEEEHWISQNHNDTAGRYLIGIDYNAGIENSSKSYVADGWDFTSSDSVELLGGNLTIDENADCANFFIENSNGYLEILNGNTFDVSGNLTNNGTLENWGTITDSGGYFDFYNTNPGAIWFNNSTVSKAKLAYYYDGFNFSIGMDANSTINEWTLEAPSGIDTAFNITYYDFNNKGSGVIWHLNATAASGSVYFGTNNLTAGERYDSYVDTVLYREHTADAGGWVNFSYNGWSTRHIYLTWVTGVPPVPVPPLGWSTPWLYRTVAFFEYEVFDFKVVDYIGENRGKYGTTTLEDFTYSWDFGDGSESDGINATHSYSFFLFKNYNVKLTVCEVGEDDCDSYEDQVMLIDWPMVALMGLLMVVLITAFILPKAIKKRYWIAVE